MTAEVVERIKTFLVNKRFIRARSTVQVVTAFSSRLNALRAARRLKKVFAASRVASMTIVERLKQIRKDNAAKALQV